MAIDCIIPAAGASTRMGAFKPLLSFGAATVVETTVAAALEAGLRVILVLGYRGGEIAELFMAPSRAGSLVLVDNPRWAEGMMTSLQAALPHVEGDHFATLPADMPLVTPALHLLLGAAWETERAAGLSPVPLFASYLGEAGHPVLVPSTLIPGLLGLGPGERARPFLLARGGRLVDWPDPSVLTDLDTDDDYRDARRAHGLD